MNSQPTDLDRARARLAEWCPDATEVERVLALLDDHYTNEQRDADEDLVRDIGLALVAAGQWHLWQTLFHRHLAGRDPVGCDDPSPGQEWAFLFGADWPKRIGFIRPDGAGETA